MAASLGAGLVAVPAGAQGTSTTAPARVCDLAIGQQVSPSSVASGGQVTISLVIANVGSGPCPAQTFGALSAQSASTLVSDPQPAGLQFGAPSAPAGWSCSAAGPGGVSCFTAATLNPGATVILSFGATVTLSPGSSVQNCATVTVTNNSDVNGANNRACALVSAAQVTTTSTTVRVTTTTTTTVPGGTTTTSPRVTTTTTTVPGQTTTTVPGQTTTTGPPTTGPGASTTSVPTPVATTGPDNTGPGTSAPPGGTSQPTIPPSPTLHLSQPSTEPGGRVSASGTGCDPGGAVMIAVDGMPAATGTAGRDGTFDIPVDLPNLAVGRYQVVAGCGRLLNSPLDIVVASSVAAPLSTLAVMIFFVLLSVVLFRRRRIVRARHRPM